MPNYYAHLRFGTQVLAGLPEPLRLRIENEYDAFTLGQYGPDPLYFCCNRKARVLGREMHHRPVREVAERLRSAVQKGVPNSTGYAAGFLCHFALDSSCHAYIKQCAVSDGLSHTEIEAEFDRFLMVYDGVDMLSQTPMPNPLMPASFNEVLEEFVYPGIKGECFRKGMDMYRKLNVWHTKTARSKLADKTLGQIARSLKQGLYLSNMIFMRESVIFKNYCEEMLKLFEKEVCSVAGKLNEFYYGASLDEWYDRDFFTA